jgi:hypothetical protein
MRKSRFTESQIGAILKQGDGGVPIGEIVRQHGISKATYFQWRSKYAGASGGELKRALLTQAMQSATVSAVSGAAAGAFVGGVIGSLAGGGFVIGAFAGHSANIGLPLGAANVAGTIAGGLATILGPPVSPAEDGGGSLGSRGLSGRK